MKFILKEKANTYFNKTSYIAFYMIQLKNLIKTNAMNSKTIDYINICLLFISFLVAIYLPFELFLFSYAVLGPLHYLTEINWLYDKKYFIKSKSKGYIIFLILAIVISVYPFMKYLKLNDIENLEGVIDLLISQKYIILLSSFIFSVCLMYFTKLKHLLLAFIFSVLFSISCNLFIPKLLLLLGIFLPTLIHVYLFTLLFMIFGLLKQKSKPGLISVLIFIAAPLIIIFLDIKPATYLISDFTKDTYSGSGFLPMNKILTSIFGDVDMSSFDLLAPIAVKIQIFIAFAYTYHYLNWFSKTSTIGWKNSLTNKRTKYIIILWLSAIGLYLYDYFTGLKALLFLSILHVILEFPLNVITIKEIGLVGIKKKLNINSK